MRLVLIRHAPLPDLAGVCYGRLDPAPGVLEASGLARLRAEIAPLIDDAPCLSSPARRCRELAAALHPAPRLDPRLLELDFGAWEGRAWEDLPREELDAWAADPLHYAPGRGESVAAMRRRVLAWRDELRDELRQSGASTALCVTHAGVIKLLLAAARGLAPADWLGLAVPYATPLPMEIR